MAWAGRENLSCWQPKLGQADYKPRWDDRRLVARTCPMQLLPNPDAVDEERASCAVEREVLCGWFALLMAGAATG